jgi:CrcB protein
LKTVLVNAAIVGSGGFIGAVCRYGMSALVQRAAALSSFPYGTLLVNLAGCLLIGVAVGMIDHRQLLSPELRLFLLVGLLGGFTTYSTFAWETLSLAKGSGFIPALTYVTLHIVAGIALAAAGYALVAR